MVTLIFTILVIFLVVFMLVKFVIYYSSLSLAVKEAEKYTQVKLCRCGKVHFPIENAKNICSRCKRNIVPRGPSYFHPIKRVWVYGNYQEAIDADIAFLKAIEAPESLTEHSKCHCNLCGKQDIDKAHRILNVVYCSKCITFIKKTQPGI